MVVGQRGGEDVRGRSGLALLEDHGPSAVVACLNAIRVNDPGAVAAVVPPDARVDDHRAASNHRFHDGRTLIETLARWGTALSFDVSLLAYRGDTHALVRLNLPLQDGVISCFVLVACAGDQVREMAIYDMDQLPRALRELGHRWARELSEEQAEVADVCADLLWAAVHRDFDTMSVIMADELTFIDHRMSVQAFDEEAAQMFRSVLDDDADAIDLPTRVEAISALGLLVWTSVVSSAAVDQLEEELVLVEVRGGQVTAIEFFDPHQLHHARLRWHALSATAPPAETAGTGAVPPARRQTVTRREVRRPAPEPDSVNELDWVDRDLIVVDGAVPQVVISLVRSAGAGSAAQLDDVFAPDLVVDDRRHRTDTPMMARGQVVHALASFGPNLFDVRLLAVRGNRLALLRIMFERTEGGIADMVVLVRGDVDGATIEGIEIHDTARFADAVRALSAAHLALLPGDQQLVLRATAGVLGAIINRDFDSLGDQLTDDFVYREHREAMPMELGREASISLLESILHETPDVIDYAPEIVGITAAGLVTTRTQSTLDRLGRTDVDVIAMRVRDEKLQRFEVFESRQLVRAMRMLSSWG